MKDLIKIIEILLKNKKIKDVKAILDKTNAIDVAELIEKIKDVDGLKLFRLLSTEKVSEVFICFSSEFQTKIIKEISDNELKNIVEDLYIDDAVDLIEELPADIVNKILKNASIETRNSINRYLKYDKNSAGSLMTSEYIALKEDMKIYEALNYIKKNAINSETIYTCFILAADSKLKGVVSIKELLLSEDDKKVSEIMNEPIYVKTNTDQEKIAELFNKYGFFCLPVVDSEGKMAGIVTIDDTLDVIEEETTEDFEIMAAITPSETPYLKTKALKLASNRILWLAVLMISDTIAGTILRSYEDAFRVWPILVSFIPMLIDTGGNAGSQSSTMIIRGIALGEISIKDFFKVIFKEFKVGIIAGFLLSLINLIRLYIMYPSEIYIISTVVLSVFIITIISKIIGAALPLIAKSLKLDPAIMAAPLITTIIDALGLIIYFKIATTLLSI